LIVALLELQQQRQTHASLVPCPSKAAHRTTSCFAFVQATKEKQPKATAEDQQQHATPLTATLFHHHGPPAAVGPLDCPTATARPNETTNSRPTKPGSCRSMTERLRKKVFIILKEPTARPWAESLQVTGTQTLSTPLLARCLILSSYLQNIMPVVD
jgi:hypothetical protein